MKLFVALLYLHDNIIVIVRSGYVIWKWQLQLYCHEVKAMLRIISSNVSTLDQLARSIVIMTTQIIIIIMFLSDDALSVFTDNLLKSKEDYKINLKLLLYHVITLNWSHNLFYPFTGYQWIQIVHHHLKTYVTLE